MSLQSSLRPVLRSPLPLPARVDLRLLTRATFVCLLVALISPTAAHARDRADVPITQRVGTRSLSLQVLPAIRQPGADTALSTDAQVVVTATLTPAEAGRLITLERGNAHGWTAKATLPTDATGRVTFFVSPSGREPATYRAYARSSEGLARRMSDLVTTDSWGAADFSDEFTGETLGSAWQHRIQFYNPWGGRACSKGDPSAVGVADGALHLTSRPDPVVSVPCAAVDDAGTVLGDFLYRLNGHVSTQDSMDFLYGVAAARMKFQRRPGAHAGFWLQPRGLLTESPTPWGAEIDVVEWYGRAGNSDKMSSTVHAPLPNGDKVQHGGPITRPSRFLTSRSDTWWRNYHVFSVEWTPTEYIFRIGGHEVWRTDQGVSHDPEFVILSMLSSDFELPLLGDREHRSQSMSVDWVKVWQAAS